MANSNGKIKGYIIKGVIGGVITVVLGGAGYLLGNVVTTTGELATITANQSALSEKLTALDTRLSVIDEKLDIRMLEIVKNEHEITRVEQKCDQRKNEQ